MMIKQRTLTDIVYSVNTNKELKVHSAMLLSLQTHSSINILFHQIEGGDGSSNVLYFLIYLSVA